MSYFCIKYGLDPRIIFSTNYPSNTPKVISNDIKHCLSCNKHWLALILDKTGSSDIHFYEEKQLVKKIIAV